MRDIYHINSVTKSKKQSLVLLFLFLIAPLLILSQTSYTFTPAGAVGMTGPTQLQINTAYFSTNLNGSVTSTGGIQTFTIPFAGNYRIEAYGASGGSSSSYTGGLGAVMKGDFTFTAGTVLKIIAGQAGIAGLAVFNQDVEQSGGTGGGGSFVATLANAPLIVAGGGGGSSQSGTGGGFNAYGQGGTVTVNGLDGGGTIGTGGLSGAGGVSYNWTGWHGGTGGGGFTGNGVGNSAGSGTYGTVNGPGIAFLNGGAGGLGGSSGRNGGFGGGGASGFTGAGGGGYSGGGAGATTGPNLGGGGGGSYNSGLNQNNTSAFNFGDGKVIITALCNITLNNLSNSSICIGNSATLTTNAISNYVWSNGNTSASIVVSPTVTTTYTLAATSPSNCTASAAITVTVDNTPTVSAATNASVVCAGKTVIMTAIGANTYTWTGGVTNASAFTPTTTGSYTVTGTNACGTSSAATSVTVNPVPSMSASVNNPTVCNGSSVILNGSGSAGGYTWTAGAPNNTAFVPPATTVYSVTGVAANGCTATAAVGVTVLITPTIVPVATPTAICFGTNGVLSAVGATGYTWTPGINLNGSTATVSPGVSTTYTLFRINGACSNTSTVNLVVNPLPLVNASASPSQICVGAGINLIVVGPITNTWLPGGFTIANFTVYPNFSTSYTVTGSNGNCTATAVVPIVVNPSPTISIASSTNIICLGNTSTLTVSGAGPLTFTWGPSGNNGVTEVVSPNTTTIITVSATNSLNCVASQNVLIQVNPVPNMNLTSSVPFICVGSPALLSLTQATANTNNNVVYNWSTGSSGANITVSPTITTTYLVTGSNTITGCQNTNTMTLSVYIATFVVSSPTAICLGQTATLTAAGQATSYTWSINGSTNGSSVTVSPLANTSYSVTGSNGSCSSSTSVPVIVNPLPNVTAVASKNQICRFEVATITGNGATSYSWNTGAITPTISFTLSLTTNYTLTGTDLNGCAKTVTVSQFVATCIGLKEIGAQNNMGFTIYPNPNNGNFTISTDVNRSRIIVDALGQVIRSVDLNDENKNRETISNLASGIYFITGESNGMKLNKKIVVER